MHTLTKIKELATTEVGSSTHVTIKVFCSCLAELPYDRYVNTVDYLEDSVAVLSDMGNHVFKQHNVTPPVVKATKVSTTELTAKQVTDKLAALEAAKNVNIEEE